VTTHFDDFILGAGQAGPFLAGRLAATDKILRAEAPAAPQRVVPRTI
jgi:hypothetical protein